MATGGQKRTRSERIAALDLPPGQWERAWVSLRRGDVLLRVGIGLLAAAALCAIARGWDPPFPFRTGHVPQRDIVSRVEFFRFDREATEAAKKQASAQVLYTYAQDRLPLVELQAKLRNAVVEVTSAANLKEALAKGWNNFLPPLPKDAPQPSEKEQEEDFLAFRNALDTPEELDRFEKAVAAAFVPLERYGVLDKLSDEVGPGNPNEIRVHPKGKPEPTEVVKVKDVLGYASILKENLAAALDSKQLAAHIAAWLRPPRIKPTLTPDLQQTRLAMEEAISAVRDVMRPVVVGQTLAKAGEPFTADKIQLLRLEYNAWMAQRSPEQRVARGLMVVAMLFAMFLLTGIYMRYRQRGPLSSVPRLVILVGMMLATVAVAIWASVDAWRAEITPLLLFGMTVAIIYRQELALLLSGILAFVMVLAVGHGLYEFLLLLGATTVAAINMGVIRTRRKLIYVGLAAGAVAFLLNISLAVVLNDQPMTRDLLRNAAYTGLWGLIAGFLMTGLLPFIEQIFGVLTDLSLLELGDVTHPLLQELVRRAPSTYNHSLTVGSIAEAAADAIGARGLLVRVGAYFHDVGKMLKPGYFVENQGAEASRHESLAPAMSTLVIIAHIKDGADLARQYRLPQPIIDLIGQHHGTTLVEYFYDRAHERSQSDPNAGEVDESSFRYPGPKPQTKEAAVLMLADVVESASRTLVDPTPARIESLVRSIAERRLHDGQFDESGLTLRELRTIERSLVMSLTSIYHGRVKYPEQRSA